MSLMTASRPLALGAMLLGAAACVQPATSGVETPAPEASMSKTPPSPDPRIGLKAGLFDAGEAIWNLRMVSTTPPPKDFLGVTNSDLAFMGKYVIQGNYNGYQVWDIANPAQPSLVIGHVCPASQSDVSVYKNLLFVSGEGLSGRLDCGTQGVQQAVSKDRLRGIRIFDISDLRNPKNVGNVQTCRGSHTHSVLVDPKDSENVYVYISGSAGVRPAEELPGCVNASPDEDPNSALFRIEVIKVPLKDPSKAAIVSSPRIFAGLVEPPEHGPAPEDIAQIERARERGAFVVTIEGRPTIVPNQITRAMLDSAVKARGATGAPTAADSAVVREQVKVLAKSIEDRRRAEGPRPGPTQCHDITLYPAIGMAGGACEGYGLLIDITDPVNPKRVAAVADSNFSYWHSATFSNDGSKVLFTDEWGGGGAPKCRATDPKEWGANAIFTIDPQRQMHFKSYFKIPAPQTPQENCVAHNGSLIPVPGRDIMVQAWYQGGITVFDWTDPANPVEIAFHDRGPVDSTRMQMGGSWSVYWYNGLIVSSEIARGLDIFELVPSAHLSRNEIEAAKSVKLDYLNAQGQPQFTWPATFALSRAYVDQLERGNGLPAARIAAVRQALAEAERASGGSRRSTLTTLASQLEAEAAGSSHAEKVRTLAKSVRDLAR